MTSDIVETLSRSHPYDAMAPERLATIAGDAALMTAAEGEAIYELGRPVTALCLILEGRVEITDAEGETVSLLGPGNSFGERGLSRDGIAPVTARATEETRYLAIPAATFHILMEEEPAFRRFFDRRRPAAPRREALTTMALGDVMTRDPLSCAADATLQEAARAMRDRRVSCILVAGEGGERLEGILTLRDLMRSVADALPTETPVQDIMTRDPVTLPPTALVSDALHTMVERGITHMPVAEAGRVVGILTQTDLTRMQAMSSAALIQEISWARDPDAIAKVVHGIPQLLAQLVGAHNAHQTVTRLVTDIADAATRRLLRLAEAELGPPPVPYLWLACGSQGRQEQTGVSDQDNCLILDDAATPEDDAYFAKLAKFVSDGLDRAGYYYCPGEMMATTPRWRQPLKAWRSYFRGWIEKPDPMAQMLASVMFDLRPIGGASSLFDGLQAETLEAASKNSIFVAHMISNSLKHQPPLGLFRGFATVRSGEHKNMIDLKHSGVVPVVDLGRVYALRGQLAPANTRARLLAAVEAGAVSTSGGRDLIDAYDVIAETRLQHQAAQIRRGEAPDNFMPPSELSDFERSHLRDAFVVVKTMQSALASRSGPLG